MTSRSPRSRTLTRRADVDGCRRMFSSRTRTSTAEPGGSTTLGPGGGRVAAGSVDGGAPPSGAADPDAMGGSDAGALEPAVGDATPEGPGDPLGDAQAASVNASTSPPAIRLGIPSPMDRFGFGASVDDGVALLPQELRDVIHREAGLAG